MPKIEVMVVDEQGDSVTGALVAVFDNQWGLLATRNTDSAGWVTFTIKHRNGVSYFAVVMKSGYRAGSIKGTQKTASPLHSFQPDQDRTIVLTLEPIGAQLFLDADRNGTLTCEDLDRWDWGPGKNKKGTIILCNHGRQKLGKPFNHDDKINAKEELRYISHLEIRRCRDYGLVTARLSVPNKQDLTRIRIFDGQQVGASELIGPNRGSEVDLDLSQDEYKFSMEGLRFDQDINEVPINIYLDILDKKTSLLVFRHIAHVRVAPWMMQHHLEKPQYVFVVEWTQIKQNNKKFRQDLAEIMTNIPDVKLVEIPTIDGDRWGQDGMEFGCSNSPQASLSSILPSPRQFGLAKGLANLCSAELGIVEVLMSLTKTLSGDLDKLGNLEVTPPVVDINGQEYPWGRIYYGDGVKRFLNRDYQKFLDAQRVQRPFRFDTEWLDVGHVDEILTFIPHQRTSWKICIPCPDTAMHWLTFIMKCGLANKSIILHDRMINGSEGGGFLEPAEMRLDLFLDLGKSITTKPGINQMRLQSNSQGMMMDSRMGKIGFGQSPYSMQVVGQKSELAKKKISGMVKILIKEISLKEEQIIRLPTLYCGGKISGCATMTANMVNMLVLGNHCILAKPYGPEIYVDSKIIEIFSKACVNADPSIQPSIKQLISFSQQSSGPVDLFQWHADCVLREAGMIPHFIDDWDVYHVAGGDVHCGTNTRRQPFLAKWWQFTGN